MTANGFLEQKQGSPLGFGTVVLLHGVAIAAVLLLKGPGFIMEKEVDTKTFFVQPDEPPAPNDPPPPQPDTPTPPQRSVIDVPERVIITPPTGPTQLAERADTPPGPTIGGGSEPSTATREIVEVPPRDPPRDPVRVASLFDPRFAGSQQPPYPPSEERAEREGQVRIRVTIGPDGRVTAAQRVAATNDAFWRATEQQALRRWRFRPSTLDGRPVQDSKVITIHFRLDGR